MKSIVALAALLFVPGGPARAQASPSMEVTVTGLHSSRGTVRVALFASPRGWPQQDEHAFRRAAAVIENGQAKVRFALVPAGTYAAVAFHDENGDEQLGTNLFGVPTEGWGASNGAHALLGPSWEAARFSSRAQVNLVVEY